MLVLNLSEQPVSPAWGAQGFAVMERGAYLDHARGLFTGIFHRLSQPKQVDQTLNLIANLQPAWFLLRLPKACHLAVAGYAVQELRLARTYVYFGSKAQLHLTLDESVREVEQQLARAVRQAKPLTQMTAPLCSCGCGQPLWNKKAGARVASNTCQQRLRRKKQAAPSSA